MLAAMKRASVSSALLLAACAHSFMRRSTLHIFIALLLAVLYVGERGMPCMEASVDRCADECSTDLHAAADSQDAHGDSSPLNQTHHCDHCSCPCHIPALSPQGERFVSAIHSDTKYNVIISRLPSASVHPPDHIPLV